MLSVREEKNEDDQENKPPEEIDFDPNAPLEGEESKEDTAPTDEEAT